LGLTWDWVDDTAVGGYWLLIHMRQAAARITLGALARRY
jgi:hypothetical protein